MPTYKCTRNFNGSDKSYVVGDIVTLGESVRITKLLEQRFLVPFNDAIPVAETSVSVGARDTAKAGTVASRKLGNKPVISSTVDSE